MESSGRAAVLSEEEFSRRASELEWLLLDVDGVLTDGGLFYDRWGHAFLRFDVRDGLGVRLAQRAGLKVGALTGRSTAPLERRASELDFDVVIKGSSDKSADFDAFLKKRDTSARRVAFVGDDLPDLRVLGRVGLSFAPADAVDEVRAVVHQVLDSRGGEGAVRELVERVIRARGGWETATAAFTFDA